jgi:D-serine deaminase-like pyridoxal phosphate-dependent protein
VGGAIFNDEHYRTHFGVTLPCALTVLTTVTSRPSPVRVVTDAGRKSMSMDTAPPRPLGYEHITNLRLSAEHAQFDMASPSAAPAVGEQVEFVVGYTDTSVHLHEEIVALRHGAVEAVWKVAGRGLIK